MGWKLTVGKVLDAWKKYPEQRASIAGMQSGRPIFLAGTHRSGTTWAAKMLAEPGMWYVHEPFNPNKKLWNKSFTYQSCQQTNERIDSYVGQLLAGRHRRTVNLAEVEHPLMPLRLFRPAIRRVMIKDPLACLLTGYIAQQFETDTVVLFRHPAGFVSSVIRLGWPLGKFLQQFLEDDLLMAEHLHPVENLLRTHADRDDHVSAAVLHGALNLVMWNQTQENPSIRHHQFEDLCDSPVESFRNLFADIGLAYSEATRERHEKLCFSGSSNTEDYHTHAVSRNSRAMADTWKRKLDASQVEKIRNVWEQFEIPLYQADDQWMQDTDHNMLGKD